MHTPASLPWLLAAALTAGGLAAQVRVAATVPPRNGMAASPIAEVQVRFQAAVQPQSVNAASFHVLGRWSGPVPGAIAVDATGTVATFRPLRPLFAGELVTVSLTRAVTAAAGPGVLTGGHQFQFMAPAGRGSFTFAQVQTIPLRRPGEGGIGTYGIYAGDVDGDGAPDLTAMNELSHDVRVLRNDGCGNYGPSTLVANPGQWPSPSDGADFDRDGRLDLITGNQNGSAVSIYRNTGTGMWGAPQVYNANGWVHGVAVLDWNGDGYPDVAAPNTVDLALFQNRGDGTLQFVGNVDPGGGGEDNVVAIDLDGDGWLDLAVGCLGSRQVGVLLSNGDGTFRSHGLFPAGGNPFNICAGDLDGDGHVDVVLANRGTSTFAALRGDGAGNLAAPVLYPVGSAPAAIDLADLDGDGDLDCVVSNYGSSDWTIWRNDGTGTFVQPFTLPAPRSGSCATLVDFDRDGDLDILGTDELDDVAVLWAQVGPAPAGVQPPSCAAALRVDQSALRAGFGGLPPIPFVASRPLAVNLSGPPNALLFLALGFAAAPGVPVPGVGIYNLDLSLPPFFLIDGFAAAAARTDGAGEALVLLPRPAGAPGGLVVALQGAVLGTNLVLTNPEAVVFAP